MNRQTLIGRMAALNTNNPKAVEIFICELADEAREGPRALVDLWLNQAAGVPRERPIILIPELEDLAIQPLLEIPPSKLTPSDHAWLINTIADAEVAFRNSIVLRLISLLDDKTPVPQPIIPNSEGQPLPRRICDEAYMALRQILQLGEGSHAAALNANAYLSLIESRRNEEIQKFKASKTFAAFVDE